jgi:hypothetical protein
MVTLVVIVILVLLLLVAFGGGRLREQNSESRTSETWNFALQQAQPSWWDCPLAQHLW